MAEASEKPLAGKRVVITRAPEQAIELIAVLQTLGAEVFFLTMVAFAPPENWTAIDEHLRRLDRFDAIVFLSANSARYVLGRAHTLGIELEKKKSNLHLFIAAVGPATARAIEKGGSCADYVAREHTGHGLAAELRDKLAGRAVLLPRSDRGNEDVPQAFRDVGARVTEFVAYKTVLPETFDRKLLDRVRRAEIDVVVFASPSAVQNFAALLGAADLAKLAAHVTFAAIGPTTAQALRDAALPVSVQAEDSSAAALASALARRHPPPSHSQ